MKGKALLEKLPKSAIWLRDHCRCSECFHPTTKQRLVNVFDMDLGISFFNQTNGNLNVEWTDGHKSTYPMSMLKGFGSVSPKFTLWDSLFQPKPVEYEEIMHGDGLRKWISNIHRFGIGFVSGVPPNAEQSKELAEKLTFIRHTHYGGFWESTADLKHGDTAYTNVALGAHNDTTYFTDPVGLLFFHLILHDGTGGESIFVDGFKCAEILRREHKWAFDALHRIEISAHSIGSAGVRIQPNHKFKILNSHNGHLDQIRYNYHDRSILHLDAADTEEFYAASREWDKIVRSKENEFWIKLTPGLAVMFNNWRVLHGRAEFTGYRTLIGSYHNMDDFRSKITTELGLKERFDV